MLCRFSSRLAVSNTQRAVAVSSLPANLWVSRRWVTEEAKKEEPKKDEGKKEEAKPEGEKKAQDAKAFENQAELQDKIKALEKEREELKKELAYALADGENARRIGREDTEKAKNFAVTGFAKSMLEVSDTLERAIENLEKLPQEMVDSNKSLAAVLTGVKMSGNVLHSVFGKNGIEKMESKVGDTFDPNIHDAIFNAPATDKAPAGTLINVVKCGYKIKERVLRAAQVGVATEQK